MYRIPNQPMYVFILSTMYLPELFYIVKKMLHMLGLIYHCLGLEIHLIIITKGRRKLWTVTGAAAAKKSLISSDDDPFLRRA